MFTSLLILEPRKRIDFSYHFPACYEVMMHEATNSAAGLRQAVDSLCLYSLLARQVRPGVRGSGHHRCVSVSHFFNVKLAGVCCQTWPTVFSKMDSTNLTCPNT